MLDLFNIPYLITTYGYTGIFTIVFLESGIFFALPGDSLLFTAGLLASTTYMKLYVLIPVIFVSGFLGGVVGYYIGIHINRLRKFKFFAKILKQEHLDRTHVFFQKHGKSAIIFSRFVPVVRTFTPIVAGVVKMDYKTFLKYNLLSAFIWSTSVTLAGYYLGRVFPWIKDYMSWVIIIVVLISLLPALVEIFRKKK